MLLVKINLELTVAEALVLRKAIQSHSPSKEDELLSFLLYNKLTDKINEAIKK